MPRAQSEPEPDLWVATQSAVYYVDGDEVIVYPGLVVSRDSPVRLARQHLYEPLVVELGYEEDLPLSQAVVLVCGSGSEHGTEMTRVKRGRTRAAPDPW